MKVTITLDRRKKDPIPGLLALIRRGANVRRRYLDMGEADPKRPGAYEHSEARHLLLKELVCIDAVLKGLAVVLGKEAAEIAHIPPRILREIEADKEEAESHDS